MGENTVNWKLFAIVGAMLLSAICGYIFCQAGNTRKAQQLSDNLEYVLSINKELRGDYLRAKTEVGSARSEVTLARSEVSGLRAETAQYRKELEDVRGNLGKVADDLGATAEDLDGVVKIIEGLKHLVESLPGD